MRTPHQWWRRRAEGERRRRRRRRREAGAIAVARVAEDSIPLRVISGDFCGALESLDYTSYTVGARVGSPWCFFDPSLSLSLSFSFSRFLFVAPFAPPRSPSHLARFTEGYPRRPSRSRQVADSEIASHLNQRLPRRVSSGRTTTTSESESKEKTSEMTMRTQRVCYCCHIRTCSSFYFISSTFLLLFFAISLYVDHSLEVLSILWITQWLLVTHLFALIFFVFFFFFFFFFWFFLEQLRLVSHGWALKCTGRKTRHDDKQWAGEGNGIRKKI